jgi:succinate dehydrogenase/fumarate reductase flavoprotein subunit
LMVPHLRTNHRIEEPHDEPHLPAVTLFNGAIQTREDRNLLKNLRGLQTRPNHGHGRSTTMHGPQLTRHELATTLRRAVERFERLGVPHEHAINAVAADRDVSPAHVKNILGRHTGAVVEQTGAVI